MRDRYNGKIDRKKAGGRKQKSRYRLGCLGAGLLLLVSVLSGCSHASQKTDPVSERDSVIIVLNPEAEPEAGFDPIYGWGAGEHVHEPLLQSTLTVTNPDLSIGYDLAEEIQTSVDGLLWTVKIRRDASFTDGERLTAEDVAFTYNTLKESNSVNDFTMLKEARALDETTVEFELEHPFSVWPYTMAVTGIVPEHAYSPSYGSHPVGSGRYKLEQWDRGQQVILTANPDYYGDAPRLKQVTILFMEEDAAFAAVKAGQADVAYTSPSYSDQDPAGYGLLSCQTVDNRGFNLPAVKEEVTEDGERIGNNVTAEVQVRRAISLYLDREAMIEHVLNGYGTPAYSVCDGMPWYQESAWQEEAFSQMTQKERQEAARSLLFEAGWRAGADGILTKDGVRAELEFLYPAGDSTRQALALDTANQLRGLGIEASVRGTGWDSAYQEAQSQPLIWGWGAHTPMELYHIYHTSGENGRAVYSPYANAAVDAYLDAALSAKTPEEAEKLWKQAQWDGTTGIGVRGDLPWVWLVNVNHLYWVRDGLSVAEQKLHPHGHGWSIVNNVDQWTWKESGA